MASLAFFLEFRAPTWPNGFEVAPEWLRREMDAAGERASRRNDGSTPRPAILGERCGASWITDAALLGSVA
jgi:hypothetical protein